MGEVQEGADQAAAVLGAHWPSLIEGVRSDLKLRGGAASAAPQGRVMR